MADAGACGPKSLRSASDGSSCGAGRVPSPRGVVVVAKSCSPLRLPPGRHQPPPTVPPLAVPVEPPPPPPPSSAPAHGTREKLRWKQGAVIGDGQLGKVYLGLNENTGQLLAVKAIEHLDPSKSLRLHQEMKALRQLRHPNLVSYIRCERMERSANLFLEYIPGSSLLALCAQTGGLRERTVASHARQIVAGLAHLHGRGIAHGDLKAANVMVSISGDLRLADFGLSALLKDRGKKLGEDGTIYWQAPEVASGEPASARSDVWSLGCTIVEILTAKRPFSHTAPTAAAFRECLVAGTVRLGLPSDVAASQACQSFLHDCCLQRAAGDRGDSLVLCHHPFLQEAVFSEVSGDWTLEGEVLPVYSALGFSEKQPAAPVRPWTGASLNSRSLHSDIDASFSSSPGTATGSYVVHSAQKPMPRSSATPPPAAAPAHECVCMAHDAAGDSTCPECSGGPPAADGGGIGGGGAAADRRGKCPPLKARRVGSHGRTLAGAASFGGGHPRAGGASACDRVGPRDGSESVSLSASVSCAGDLVRVSSRANKGALTEDQLRFAQLLATGCLSLVDVGALELDDLETETTVSVRVPNRVPGAASFTSSFSNLQRQNSDFADGSSPQLAAPIIAALHMADSAHQVNETVLALLRKQMEQADGMPSCVVESISDDEKPPEPVHLEDSTYTCGKYVFSRMTMVLLACVICLCTIIVTLAVVLLVSKL
ncbi:Protein kinase byr2 [Diplonema papillatum]|nr:Protein kinase byr2 [Diplonema papillatum]